MLKVVNATVFALFAVVFLLSPTWAGSAGPYATAVADYNAGKYGAALGEFETCRALYPTNSMVHYYLALSAQNMGRFDKAAAEFRWVADHGDAKLKALAQIGLTQLLRVHPTTSHYVNNAPAPAIVSSNTTLSKSKVARVIDFYADWCGPCQAFAPAFEEVKSRMHDISFERYNVDDQSTQAIRTKCPPFSSIPHIVFMDASGNVLFGGSPARDAQSFEQQISQYR